MFEVRMRCKESALDPNIEFTYHASKERDERKELVEAMGEPKVYMNYYVYIGHADGYQIHTVTTSGCVYIMNWRTRKVITFYVAKRWQLERLGVKRLDLLEQADVNERMGYARKESV